MVLFDDYTLHKTSSSQIVSVSAESRFGSLGVDFAGEGQKPVEWGSKVSALRGVSNLDAGERIHRSHDEEHRAESTGA